MRLTGLLFAAAMVTLTAGCTNAVTGTAIRAEGGSAGVPLLTESDLDDLVLDGRDVSRIAGSRMEEFTASQEMTYLADLVSDPSCTGAVFPLDEDVYSVVDWSAARDTIFVDAAGDSEVHVVEQGLVLYDTPAQAQEFFEVSLRQWQRCGALTDLVADESPWLASEVEQPADNLIVQDADHIGYAQCQHALGVVANLIVESLACDTSFSGEAEAVVAETLRRAGG